MSKFFLALIAACLVGVVYPVLAGPEPDAATTRRQAEALWSEEGLQPVKVSGLDVVFSRPGATLAGFTKVLVNPVSVAFQRDWERSVTRDSGSQVRPQDMKRIRDDLAAIVRREIVRELGNGGYQVVDVAGADVLEINPRVAELWINAPDLPTPGITRSYTMSFGRMTLIVDLRDSMTGETVMRILDRSLGRDYGIWRLTTRVENTQEARRVANAWAVALRKELDLARGIGSKH